MKRFTATLTTNTTITVNLTANQDCEILLTQGGALGNYTVTWVGVDKWFTPNGLSPVLQTGIGKSDLLQFSCAGTTIFGVHAGDTGAKGDPGVDGPIGFTWQSLWSSTKDYGASISPDVISYGGSSYISIGTSGPSYGGAVTPVTTGQTAWELFAQAGQSGGASTWEDTFARGGTNTNISQGSPLEAGGGYTEYGGALEIAMGTLDATPQTRLHSSDISGNYPSNVQYARAEQALTSVDHFAQLTLNRLVWTSGVSSFRIRVAVRYEAAANSHYYLSWDPLNAHTNYRLQIGKWVAGADAAADLSGSNIHYPVTGYYDSTGASTGNVFSDALMGHDVLKLTVSGTSPVTLTGYRNGIALVSATDSSVGKLVAGTRCGFGIWRSASTADVWASDFLFGV